MKKQINPTIKAHLIRGAFYLLLLVAVCAIPFALAAAFAACTPSEEPYKPQPANSGRKANLPSVPTMPSKPIKVGDAYTIYGASHHLKSRVHNPDVANKDITITGYIVKTNLMEAPECAVHKTGKKDPDDCKTDIPSFTIADNKGDTKGPQIKVMGWASNFANVFEAMEKYKNLKAPPTDKEVYKDELWAIDVPYPLPSLGAKVKVTGRYGFNFAKSSSGIASDPLSGIITYTKIEVLEEAPEKAAFAKNDGKK